MSCAWIETYCVCVCVCVYICVCVFVCVWVCVRKCVCVRDSSLTPISLIERRSVQYTHPTSLQSNIIQAIEESRELDGHRGDENSWTRRSEVEKKIWIERGMQKKNIVVTQRMKTRIEAKEKWFTAVSQNIPEVLYCIVEVTERAWWLTPTCIGPCPSPGALRRNSSRS